MTATDDLLRRHGNGLGRAVGAFVYEDEHQEERVMLVTPEEEAIRFLLDGLGVESITELKQLVDDGRDADLSCLFTPQCIRDHFDIGGGGELDAWVASADEGTLRKVGADALTDDRLWQTFHEILVDAIRERL